MLYICTRNSTPGMSARHPAGVADIFKRRLLALCSDYQKSRKFQLCSGLSNGRCPTGYRLSLLCLLVRLLHIHICAHAYLNYVAREYILYSAWASRCRFKYFGQCEGLKMWNWQRQVSRFFCMPLKLLNNQLNNKRRQPKIR